MGSDSSKPSTSRPSRDAKDPYKALANRVANDINTRHPNGLGKTHIATAVPNPKGKDPLIMMLRQNEEGKYEYDQQHYDKGDELLRNIGAGVWIRAEDDQRRAENIHGEQIIEGRGEDGDTWHGVEGANGLAAGLRGDMGGQLVYALVAGDGGGNDGGLGGRLGGDGGVRRGSRERKRGKERVHSFKGNVDVDMGRQAFVRRKK